MPLIRYELGDLAEWGPPCSCGMTLPVIARLWGAHGNRSTCRLVSGCSCRILGDELGLIEPIPGFRIRQYLCGELEIQAKTTCPLSTAEPQCVRDVFSANGMGALPLFVREVAQIDWPAGLKREEITRTECRWPPLALA